VFDRVLLRILQEKGKFVTVAVKGAPVINDATLDDAVEAGITEYTELIDNGSDGIGTLSSPVRTVSYSLPIGRYDHQQRPGQFREPWNRRTIHACSFFQGKVPAWWPRSGPANGDIVLMQGCKFRIADFGLRISLFPTVICRKFDLWEQR
jgi:hypothetical protein